MKIRVLRGTVKYNDTIYSRGQSFELADDQAKQIIKEGMVERVIKNTPVEPKVEEKEVIKELEPSEGNKDKGKNERGATIIKPSIDWTRKELEEYALGVGVENPDKLYSKDEILEAIKSQEVK